jgi:hypothetical protein
LYRALDAGIDAWYPWESSARRPAGGNAAVIKDLKAVAFEVMAH